MLDICAGAGGKTLAFAAAMRNTGQIYAYDDEAQRLRPIFERLKRAGARNVQVLRSGDSARRWPRWGRASIWCSSMPPARAAAPGAAGPTAKWRLKPANLDQRQEQQRSVLAAAAPLVKPGGRLVYVTCSVLPEENGDQVAWFLAESLRLRARYLGARLGRRASAASRPRPPTAVSRRCSSRRRATAPMGFSLPFCDDEIECCGGEPAHGGLA